MITAMLIVRLSVGLRAHKSIAEALDAAGRPPAGDWDLQAIFQCPFF
jgi:hypothetical protein